MSIVTKTGDSGESSLYDGSRAPKHDPRFEVLGSLDELNAHLGLLRAKGIDEITPFVERLQNQLFELGAMIATPGSTESMSTPLSELEAEIDALEPTLSPLTAFILPGGHELAALTHITRTLARKAERALAALEEKPHAALPFLNRLSDYLFLLAREVNKAKQTEEKIWKSSR